MNQYEMVVLIVVVVMVASVIRVDLRRRPPRPRPRPASGPRRCRDRRLRDEVKQLKDRLAVIERITVEKENSLEREIERLQGPIGGQTVSDPGTLVALLAAAVVALAMLSLAAAQGLGRLARAAAARADPGKGARAEEPRRRPARARRPKDRVRRLEAIANGDEDCAAAAPRGLTLRGRRIMGLPWPSIRSTTSMPITSCSTRTTATGC